MKIVVCIKQVPDTADIQWTEHNTMDRASVESIINPYDELALEAALSIKDEVAQTSISAITMGPKQAENMLKYAIALGCDDGILLSDGKFAGADTIATSRTLAAGIQKKCPDFGLIICGQIAIDGDTAQTGVGIAQNLNLPQVTYVTEILKIGAKSIIVTKQTDAGIATVEVQLPTLICIAKYPKKLRKPLISGFITAQDFEIKQLDTNDIGLDPQLVGLKGSPTFVAKAFHPNNTRRNETVKKDCTEDYVEFLQKKVDGIC